MQQSERRLLRMKQVSQKIGLSVSAIYERLNRNSKAFDPTFPRGVPLGNGRTSPVVWLESDIDAWIDAQFSKRGGEK